LISASGVAGAAWMISSSGSYLDDARQARHVQQRQIAPFESKRGFPQNAVCARHDLERRLGFAPARYTNSQRIPDCWNLSSVAPARGSQEPFEIVAGGTRRSVGNPSLIRKGGDLPLLDVSGLSASVKYEPEELILTAAPATPAGRDQSGCWRQGTSAWASIPPTGRAAAGSTVLATLAGAASCDASGSGRFAPWRGAGFSAGFHGLTDWVKAFRGGAKVVQERHWL